MSHIDRQNDRLTDRHFINTYFLNSRHIKCVNLLKTGNQKFSRFQNFVFVKTEESKNREIYCNTLLILFEHPFNIVLISYFIIINMYILLIYILIY